MKTYLSIFTKTATKANNKKEAAKKLGISTNTVITSSCHIDYCNGYKKI